MPPKRKADPSLPTIGAASRLFAASGMQVKKRKPVPEVSESIDTPDTTAVQTPIAAVGVIDLSKLKSKSEDVSSDAPKGRIDYTGVKKSQVVAAVESEKPDTEGSMRLNRPDTTFLSRLLQPKQENGHTSAAMITAGNNMVESIEKQFRSQGIGVLNTVARLYGIKIRILGSDLYRGPTTTVEQSSGGIGYGSETKSVEE